MERRWSCLARATTKRIVIEMARGNLISVPLCCLKKVSALACYEFNKAHTRFYWTIYIFSSKCDSE